MSHRVPQRDPRDDDRFVQPFPVPAYVPPNPERYAEGSRGPVARLIETSEEGLTPVLVIGLAALIGIPAALVAAVFLAVVNWLERWLWTDLPGYLGASAPPWYLVLGLPVVGACLVVAARTLLPGDGGHLPLAGLSMAPTPLKYGPGIALAAVPPRGDPRDALVARDGAKLADLPTGRPDEIGELATTFAEVVAQLSEREAAL